MASTKFDTRGSTGLSYPPLDGPLLFPELLEYNAEHNPDNPFFVYPGDEGTSDVRKISHLEFYLACQRVAHAVRPAHQGKDREVVAIMANCDTILYQALFMGVIYAGLIVRWSVCHGPCCITEVTYFSRFQCHREIQHLLL